MRKDIKDALFAIDNNKSLGLDVFGAGFFKALWDVVGNDFTEVVNEFFKSLNLPKVFSSAVLVLIPIIENPSDANDYQRIACCSTVYKCISKLICMLLGEVLPFLIDGCYQGAFVKRRHLAHNVLIVQDLLRFNGRSRVSPGCMLKVNMSKVYDTVSWEFVHDLLLALVFPDKFINWIMACLRSAHCPTP